MSQVMAGMMKRFTQGEMLIIAGSLLILLISVVLTGVLLDKYFPPDAPVVISIAMLAVILLERMGQATFGTGYRLILLVLGLVIAVVSVYYVIYSFRVGFGGSDGVAWLGRLAWWVGGLMAGAGGWLVFKGR